MVVGSGPAAGARTLRLRRAPHQQTVNNSAYRPVVKPGPPLSAVLDGLVKPRPPLLRVNRRILVFFFRRGRSGFHAAPDMRWRGWSGFHAAPDRGGWLRGPGFPPALGLPVGCLVTLFFFCGVGVVDDEVVEAEGVGCFGGGDQAVDGLGVSGEGVGGCACPGCG